MAMIAGGGSGWQDNGRNMRELMEELVQGYEGFLWMEGGL